MVTTTQTRNLDRILLAVAGQQEAVSVSSLVGAALVQFSDSYARTRIRELRARGLLEQEGTGGPYRLTAAGRAMLTELDGSEAAA